MTPRPLHPARGLAAAPRAMTFPEMLLSMVGIVAALGVVLAVCVSLRADTAQSRTVETLAALRAAYDQWRADAPRKPAADAPQTTSQVLARLLDHPAARRTLADAGVRVDHLVDGSLRVRDGYGWPVRFVPPRAAASGAAPAHAADFVSAGPDGRFGAAAAFDEPTEATHAAGADDLLASDRETLR